jgi:DNA-directed RNA polymerase specialized sigma24 family protein
MSHPSKKLARGSAALQAFPVTKPLVGAWIEEENEDQLSQYLVSVYWKPLLAYYESLPLKDRPGGRTAADAVQEFFVRKLCLPGKKEVAAAECEAGDPAPRPIPAVWYLRGWRANHSTTPLRRYLASGLLLALKTADNEDGRVVQRLQPSSGTPALDLASETDGEPWRAMDRAMARTVVQRAREAVERELESRGLADHARAFFLRVLEGLTYARIGEQLGVDADRARQMCETAGRNFRDELRRVIVRDQGPEGIDRVIQMYMESVRS